MKKASKPTAKMRRAGAPKRASGRATPAPETITAIAVTCRNYSNSGNTVEVVYALCADNTLWRYPAVGADPANMVWTQIPPPNVPGATSPSTMPAAKE